MSGPLLADCIVVPSRFLRSMNLEKDYGSARANGGYIVTPNARAVLRRVAEGLSCNSTYRAWTLTGPYGVGKSAFALYLTRLLCDGRASGRLAWRQLQDVDPPLAKELKEKLSTLKGRRRRFLPVLLTARRAPAALCFAQAIQPRLDEMEGEDTTRLASDVRRFIKDVTRGGQPDSRRLMTLMTAFESVARQAGYPGVLLLVDEMGKLFEFAARTPQRGDVFAIQEIAEHAGRSGGFPLLFLGFLHQAFEDYGVHLDGPTRKEWAKIHGRFEDVAFLEPPDQAVRMIATAIKWADGIQRPPALTERLEAVAKHCGEFGATSVGMRRSEFEELSVKAYPLHPLTLAALPFIFRRFAQNERSLFSYLGSREPSGFQDFLLTNRLTAEPALVRLDGLFDYFTTNFGVGLFRQPQARRWMEAADVLERKEGLQRADVLTVKTIGVLGALGEFSHLRPSERMISAALEDSAEPTESLRAGLRRLREMSVLTYRSFNDTYRIWEGSDVDIDDRIAEGRRKVQGSVGLAAAIQQYLEPRPVVARRHSYETGALRYFETVYLDEPARVAEPPALAPGATGQILVCLPSGPGDVLAYRQVAELMQDRADVVVAIPQEIGDLVAAVTELAAMRWAWENTPPLRDDRVARRELGMRMAEAEYFLRTNLGTLLDPRPDPIGSHCLWYWKGQPQEVTTRVAVSKLLSIASSALFSQTPIIRNELIGRRFLSSAAAAARRSLIERMLSQRATLRNRQ